MALQQYRQVLYSAAALGGASGRTLALNNESWAQLDKVLAVYVATATVGNRVPTFRLLDAAGTTVLFQQAAIANVKRLDVSTRLKRQGSL